MSEVCGPQGNPTGDLPGSVPSGKRQCTASPVPLRGHNRQSAVRNRQSLAFLLLLLASVALRMIALDWPLVDAHNTRQCQTAILTKNMMAEGGLPLAAHADWMGDAPGKLFYELPLYNWTVLPVARALGNLDVAGKLVSIAFWALAFWLNHLLMRRVLTSAQARWGDLLFALSPLSIFFGQAFQPESLILLLSVGMVLAFVIHQERGDLGSFALCVGISLVSLTVKANEVSHLFLLIALLALTHEGWTCVLRPRYWVFLALTFLTLCFYGGYMTEINSVSFPEWTATGNLRKFTGKLSTRFDWFFYTRMGIYLVFLVCTPLAAVVTAAVAWRVFRLRRARLYLLWTLSLIFFYLFWGPGTSYAHSYYNLPALPVACGLFGLVMSTVLAACRRYGRRWVRVAVPVAATFLILGAAAGSVALFWPDHSALRGATALRRAMGPSKEWVFCYPNHTRYGPGYTHYATLFHLADVKGWNENPEWTEEERETMLAKCRWAIELRYVPESQFRLREWTCFSNRPGHPLSTTAVSSNPDFVLVEEAPAYRIWKRR